MAAPREAIPPPGDVPILRWVWRAYFRHALVPLLVVELLLIAAYLTSHAWSQRKNVAALADVASHELTRFTGDQAVILGQQLGQVASLTDVLRRRVGTVLTSSTAGARTFQRATAPAAARSGRDADAAAVFWPARITPAPEQLARLERLAVLDPLLRDITLSNPLIVQAYVNTHDSLSRIWPWIDVASTFDPELDVPSFNFYYEADARHNPSRDVVWTDAYEDPFRRGWLVSAVAPVYRGEFLEAVVGADVPVELLVADVLTKEVPWNGFLLLIGQSGTLLAAAPGGAEHFGLVQSGPLGASLEARPAGSGRFVDDEPHLVAWQTIPAIGWKVLTLVPEQSVFGASRALNRELATVGWVLVAGLIASYAVFFAFLYRRARYVSRSIADPLARIERMAYRIGVGEYEHAAPASGIAEFRHTVGELTRLGRLLGESNRAREAAERRLSDRAEELSTILALSPDGLVSFDAQGRVTETNPAFLEQTGWSREAFIGITQSDFWTRLAELGFGAEPRPGGSSILRLPHPRPRVLECRVIGASGGPQVAYFRDVTQADELDRAKSRFVATAAHELRTPIAVITGYAEYLQSNDPPPDRRAAMLATLRRHGEQVARMVTELLDLARIEGRGGRDFTLVRQPLAPVVRHFVDSLRIGDFARLPTLEGEIGDVVVQVDADKFGQALLNVLANARKYSPAGAPVAIRLVATAAEAGVRIVDRGQGMDEDTKSRVFEAFFRGEATAGIAGTGLGMTIVKEIMDIHGGRIEIETAPGTGTAVTLWLPRAAARG